MCNPLRLLSKMFTSFEEWKKVREGRAPAPAGPPPSRSISTRAALKARVEPGSTDDVLSFNQMKRQATMTKGRPTSEIGSIRSYQSVATVEEQVMDLESRVDKLTRAQEAASLQQAETQALLREILQRMEGASSSAQSSQKKKVGNHK